MSGTFMSPAAATHPSGDLEHYYDRQFLSGDDHSELRAWLSTLQPLWEDRYPSHRPLRHGQTKRRLLRPVYWLGNWQFACLNYYRPPQGVVDRCVRAEPFPPRLAHLVGQMEAIARGVFSGVDLPAGWKLNTCLINLYGRRREGELWVDSARVRGHKDFEPGPVASLSLGERALFQFVENNYPEQPGEVLAEQWLENGSLQIFGGARWKELTLHRVERVERSAGHRFVFPLSDFETRRVNFTFRYVPEEHIVSYACLSEAARQDVERYVRTLSGRSAFFREELAKAGP